MAGIQNACFISTPPDAHGDSVTHNTVESTLLTTAAPAQTIAQVEVQAHFLDHEPAPPALRMPNFVRKRAPPCSSKTEHGPKASLPHEPAKAPPHQLPAKPKQKKKVYLSEIALVWEVRRARCGRCGIVLGSVRLNIDPCRRLGRGSGCRQSAFDGILLRRSVRYVGRVGQGWEHLDGRARTLRRERRR